MAVNKIINPNRYKSISKKEKTKKDKERKNSYSVLKENINFNSIKNSSNSIQNSQINKVKEECNREKKECNKKINKKEILNNSFTQNLANTSEKKSNYEINNDSRETYKLSDYENDALREKIENIYKRRVINFFKITGCIVLLFGISRIAYYVNENIEGKNENILSAFDESFNNKISDIDTNCDLRVAVNSLSSSNVIINELDKLCYSSLIKYDLESYKVQNDLAESIEISNDGKIYTIKLKEKSSLNYIIEKLNTLKSENVDKEYGYGLIESAMGQDDTIAITLKKASSYFIYYLNFNIENMASSNFSKEKSLLSKTVQDKIIYTPLNKNALNNVILTKYEDNLQAIDAFKNEQTDVIFLQNQNELNMLGTYEYNVKNYRTGKSIMLFFNKDNSLLSNINVRKIIAYGLDREKILKNSTYSAETIDIPYLYSNKEYKYDVYDVKNICIKEGYVKDSSGIYTNSNKLNEKLSFRILVNSSIEENIKLSEAIKEELYNVGVNIDIEYATSNEIEERVNSSNYDILLTNINLNSNPDITYFKTYLELNEEIANKMYEIDNLKDITLLNTKIKELKDTLSQNIACIGLYTLDMNVVVRKNIVGMDDIDYLNIFKDFTKIGKKIE